MSLRVRTLSALERSAFAERIAALEADAQYPLGHDSFHLDHGPDYFAFFDRLGEVHYDIVLDEDRVVAVAARVLRTLGAGREARECWYACDLKVHPEYRGRHLPFRMAAHAFVRAYRRCPRGYAISMNPGDGSENRVVRLLGRIRVLPVTTATELVFFSLDAQDMTRAVSIVEAHRGPVGYLSLRGVKDLVLTSTGRPMPLLHVQFGPGAQPQWGTPQQGASHMLSAPRGDPLTRAMMDAGFKVGATASVMSHGIGPDAFRWILTSEI
jgi:GNAT superfamily N-acetyltransferase